MQYYRNSELAHLYSVSRSAVGKWVEAARMGKLDLTLVDSDGKSFIANTTKNHTTIKAMVGERRKYFNTRSLKTVAPKPEFYKLFTPDQVTDIIANLKVHREIPRQYNYMDGGAVSWDAYARRLYRDNAPGLANSTPQLLELSQPYLDRLLATYKRVNVVDIGPGNAMPIKGLLAHLIDKGTMGRYLAIDISPEMLEIARRNIKEWFGDQVPFEADVRDITHERFTDLLTDGSYDDDSINLVLFLGGTLYNFRQPDQVLRTIYDSMAPPDLLVCSQKLDTEAARRYFDFSLSLKANALPEKNRLVVDLLNIDDSFYTAEMGYDEQKRQRYIRARLNVAISIEFQLGSGTRRVDFDKGDTILVWRYWHYDSLGVIEHYERNGFGVLQAVQTETHEYSLIVCDIKTERQQP